MDERIEKIRAGDEAATVSLIQQNELRIRLYAARVAPRPDMAEDISQQAFLVALDNIAKFDPAGDFALWMQGIVRNVARQEWERLAARSGAKRDALADYLEALAGSREETGADEAQDRVVALRKCVGELPDRSREIVRLRYGLGMSCQDVSGRIGTSVQAVKMALVRIRGMLRDCIRARLAGAKA